MAQWPESLKTPAHAGACNRQALQVQLFGDTLGTVGRLGQGGSDMSRPMEINFTIAAKVRAIERAFREL